MAALLSVVRLLLSSVEPPKVVRGFPAPYRLLLPLLLLEGVVTPADGGEKTERKLLLAIEEVRGVVGTLFCKELHSVNDAIVHCLLFNKKYIMLPTIKLG